EVEERIPSVETIEKLSAVLHVSPCFLAFGVERPFEPRAIGRTAEISLRLRSAREEGGLSQNALAKASGVARTMIGYIESGDTTPSVATVELLAAALRVSVCWLAFAEGDMAPLNRPKPSPPHPDTV